MKQIIDAVRRGGGDEMIVLRAYRIADRLYCDVRNPMNCEVFFKVPVVSNLGAAIDAPSTPWHTTKIPMEKLPRVLVTYRSSQGQALMTPVITAVVKNRANKVVSSGGSSGNSATPSGSSAATSRPTNPGVNDASMATANAKVIARAAGGLDLISSEEMVTKAKEILLVAGGIEPVKAVAIAEELAVALQPLYDTVNSLVSFANSFPTAASVMAHPLVVAAGGVLPTPLAITMTYGIEGFSASTGAPLVIPIIPFELVPYDGVSAINNPSSEEYDSPNVRVSPRN
jgi:hypothetical protein